MATTKQKNYRLPPHTQEILDALKAKWGITEVQIVIRAIEQLGKEELSPPEQKPR